MDLTGTMASLARSQLVPRPVHRFVVYEKQAPAAGPHLFSDFRESLLDKLDHPGPGVGVDLDPGTDAEVAWIADGTSMGRTITAAVPPVFEAFATVVLPPGDEGQDQHDRAMLAVLSEQSPGQRWWLGYLDTGADDIVFPDAPKVTLYSGWHYLLVEAGPEQAATWRRYGDWSFWKGALPNLMFPADRSWLVSTLWDDDWSCIGGPARLVDRFLRHPDLQARAVALGEDATPPGHQAL